jgi:hypothetical protein
MSDDLPRFGRPKVGIDVGRVPTYIWRVGMESPVTPLLLMTPAN